MRRTVLILMVAAALGLAACGSKAKKPEGPAGGTVAGAQTSGADAASAAGGNEEGERGYAGHRREETVLADETARA